MSRDYHGERWQSRSTGSRRMRSQPQRRHSEKPRERGFRFGAGSETVTRRKTPGLRPPAAEKARQRASAWGDSMASFPNATHRHSPQRGVWP